MFVPEEKRHAGETGGPRLEPPGQGLGAAVPVVVTYSTLLYSKGQVD